MRKFIKGFAVKIFVIAVLMISLPSINLSDHNINGFVGVAGAARLSVSSNSYVRLTHEPLQLLFLRQDWYNFVWDDWYYSDLMYSEHFNFHTIAGCGYACFSGNRGGVWYHASPRAFTRRFYIVTIEMQ